MPPKAPPRDRDKAQGQLIYAMLLGLGPPSGGEAWSHISASIPDCADGTARFRWNPLKAKWDSEMLFGENHYEVIEAEVRRADARGKGKEKGVEVKKEPESEGEGQVGVGMDVDEEPKGDEGEVVAEPVVKKKAGRPKKQPKKAVEAVEAVEADKVVEDEEEEKSVDAMEDEV
ncbi:uncharacterized protein PAC_09075 [Phialocephala subalpina]|uniref:Uncharacterized protein n=1 Tax=Phialocephala subalpina TaxID=576137 RepID=A0A1L7X2D3_9HELO|nr:uncharacterized protein PAC_09075 [Phialocephala subalpina]